MILALLLLAVLLALVLGVAAVGLVVQLLWWGLVGLIIGALGRLVLPGPHPIGLLGTAAAGIAGAILGGIVANALDVGGLLQLVLAVIAAALVIAVFTGGARRAYA